MSTTLQVEDIYDVTFQCGTDMMTNVWQPCTEPLSIGTKAYYGQEAYEDMSDMITMENEATGEDAAMHIVNLINAEMEHERKNQNL